MAGERGVAAAGLGAGQGVDGVLLGCGRSDGDRQHGERWAAHAAAGEAFLWGGL